MTKKQKKKLEYAISHKLAKFICAIVNTALFEIIFKLDWEQSLLFAAVNLTYFFGVNTIARIIEKFTSFKEKHDWV